MKRSQKLQAVCCKSLLYLKRSMPAILTCLTAVGVVATAVMAAKAAPKAEMLLDEATERKDEELTKTEALRLVVPIYIPTVLIGLSTIACVFGANILNKRQRAAYISAYTLLQNSYKEYKDKVSDMFSDNANGAVRNAVAQDKYDENNISHSDDKLVFYEENYGDFFELTKEEVLIAENELNRTFILKGYVSLNEFYAYLGLPEKDFGEALGWSRWAGGAFYGYSWIDFEHKKHALDDGLEYYIISMPFPPTMDFMDAF